MAEPEDLENDLRKMIQQRQIVVVAGSGVATATSTKAPKWRDLIESGLVHCKLMGCSEAWCGMVRSQLGMESEPDVLLSAAELVHGKLSADGGGELALWLRESFEGLPVEDRSLVESISELGTPLLTLNFDGLIEEVTGLAHVTWLESRNLTRVVRGEDKRVLHLHGHWSEPESVVLGIRGFEKVKNHGHAQAVLQAFGVQKSFLFVGCEESELGDPNLGSFLAWLKAIEGTAGTEHRHYRLVVNKDARGPEGRVFPLAFGETPEELAGFLRGLRPDRSADEIKGAGTPASRVLPALPASVQHYLTRLAAGTAKLRLMGMGRSLQVELPIEEAYVPLKTTLTRSLKEHKSVRFGKEHAEHEEDVELGDVFQKTASLGEKGIVLLGEPGSGKTTGARQLAWRLSSRQTLSQDLGLPPGMIPVLLRFRNISQEALEEKNGLRRFLEEETHCDEAPDGCESPGGDLWNGRGGGLLWILDGLDEVTDPAARKKVSGWLRKMVDNRPTDRFLVTCRFQGYHHEGVPLGPGFVEFHVRPLDGGQVERFVRDWFGAAYRKLLGEDERAVERATLDGDTLLAILSGRTRATGRIGELSSNPLLLTILCIVFHEERKLPTGRAELYAHCVRVLLEYWRRDLYDTQLGTRLKPYDAEAAQSVLARVAWWMHQKQDRTEAPMEDLAEEAARGLAEVSPSSGLGSDGQAFLERMRDEAGILAGEGQCEFLHLSFQEYLAAEHAAREGCAKELVARATESWWREVALLSLRRSRPYCEAFFGEMLEAGIAEHDPDLASRCLQEALYFPVKPFRELLKRDRPRPKQPQEAHDKRVAAVLRLLLDRAEELSELEEIVAGLTRSPDSQTAAFAREFLKKGGYEIGIELGEGGEGFDERSGITFVRIPAGEFLMGSETITSEEQPIHLVRLTQGFEFGKYPVTNAQYARYLKASPGARTPQYWSDRRFNQPEQPVVGVSWAEAVSFCKWAGCRLPTEAEWEYGCRAGTRTEFSFGDDGGMLGDYGWFEGNSGSQTQPVGSKKPNGWGLHDMHGNVWEWCQDWYGDGYYDQSPEVNPPGPGQGSLRVIRGGSWDFYAEFCRSAYRGRYSPSSRNNFLGFRVARSSVH